jgi:hypothetical protein
MQRFLSVSLLLFTVVCLLVATERQALAYVDPGSGLLALQSLASVAAACGYFFRRRIKSLFGRKDAEIEAVAVVATKEGKPADAA